jgi:hypothetical protein
MLGGSVAGVISPDLFGVIAIYHPKFALAVLEGIHVRPNLRVIEAEFSSPALNQPVKRAFDQQITGYSIFTGTDVTIDPTNNLGSGGTANPLKYLSDAAQPETSGITATLLVRSRNEADYSPIPVDTPLQSAKRTLDKSAGAWGWDNPDNAFATFTLIAVPPADAFTVWWTFSFLVLGEGADPYLCMPVREARAHLLKYGYPVRVTAYPSAPVGPSHAPTP